MVNFRTMCYLWQVRYALPCSGRIKRKIMKRIYHDLNDYLVEDPGANYDKVLNRFGSPESIAVAYVGDLESKELLNELRTRRSILKLSKILIAFIVVVWVTFTGIALLDSIQQSGGYEVTYVVDGKLENNEAEE